MEKGSKLESCFTDFPERSFDVGIAEEHAVTMSGSFSLTEYHPILSIYSTFLQRGFDELLHDCARIHADMTLCIDRAGLVGKDGETHMGIYDEAYLSAIPNVTLTMPGTFAEGNKGFLLNGLDAVSRHTADNILHTRNVEGNVILGSHQGTAPRASHKRRAGAEPSVCVCCVACFSWRRRRSPPGR